MFKPFWHLLIIIHSFSVLINLKQSHNSFGTSVFSHAYCRRPYNKSQLLQSGLSIRSISAAAAALLATNTITCRPLANKNKKLQQMNITGLAVISSECLRSLFSQPYLSRPSGRAFGMVVVSPSVCLSGMNCDQKVRDRALVAIDH